MSNPETHSHTVPGGRGHWLTEKLWAAAAGLPVFRIAITDIPEFDQDCWFRGRAPSLRQVAAHAARIQSADLGYPIILSADGRLMDGGHRIARAWIEGRAEIDAVRFEVDPPPEFIR